MGEEKWRRDGAGAPEGWLGEGKRSHDRRRILGNHWEGRGSKGNMASQVSPAHLSPQEPAEIHPDPLPTEAPSSRAGPEGVGGREGGAKVKAGPQGQAPLRGGWGRGGVPTPRGTHPWLGVQRQRWRPWGRWWGGAQRNGREPGQHSPCPPRHPRPNPLPWEPPSCHSEPKPCPYNPIQGPTSTFGDTLHCAGPKPHPHTLTQGPTSKLRNSTLQRPSFPGAATPSKPRS